MQRGRNASAEQDKKHHFQADCPKMFNLQNKIYLHNDKLQTTRIQTQKNNLFSSRFSLNASRIQKQRIKFVSYLRYVNS